VVTADGNEAAPQQRLEVLEEVRVGAAHHVDEFDRQFEWRALKLHITWRVVEDEAVVNVEQTTVAEHHDIAIVAILDLQQVAHERIGRQRLDEIQRGPRQYIVNAFT